MSTEIASQVGAVKKRIASNVGDAMGNRDTRQTGALKATHGPRC